MSDCLGENCPHRIERDYCRAAAELLQRQLDALRKRRDTECFVKDAGSFLKLSDGTDEVALATIDGTPTAKALRIFDSIIHQFAEQRAAMPGVTPHTTP